MDIKEKVGRLAIAITSFSIYLPVIAGIITPMIWLLAAWYSAWYVIGVIFPFSEIWTGLWLPNLSPTFLIIIGIIEYSIVCIGLIILIKALWELSSKRFDTDRLVTTGLYQRVRHPQHLGISIALLPLALLNVTYSPYWSGIRPGDIFAWSFVTFLLLVVSDLEEAGLSNRFKDEYEVYCKKTPFFLPWKFPFRIGLNVKQLERGKPARYVIGFVAYWCIMVITIYPFTLIHLDWTM